MRYRYRPRRASAPTEIFISPLHYPQGYEVLVEGGRVTHDDGRIATIAEDREADVGRGRGARRWPGGRTGDAHDRDGTGSGDGDGDVAQREGTTLPATGGQSAATAAILLAAGVTLLRRRSAR